MNEDKNLSDQGWAFISKPRHEGFSAKPYLCPARVPTIGYGTTYYPNGKKVTMQDAPISREYAAQIGRMVIAKDFEAAIDKYVKVKLNQEQFDAVCSLLYNIGVPNFLGSSVLRHLNAGNFRAAADAFLPWNKGRVNGELKVLPGLVTRRAAERKLFLGQGYDLS